MVASELGNVKPYAIPVRVMPYQSIKDAMFRDHMGMPVVSMYKCINLLLFSLYLKSLDPISSEMLFVT